MDEFGVEVDMTEVEAEVSMETDAWIAQMLS